MMSFDMRLTLPRLSAFALASVTLVATVCSGFSANVTLTAKDGVGATSFNAPGRWSNAAAPSAGNAYSTAGFSLRTPANANPYTFAGDSLTVPAATDGDSGIIFKGTGGTITIPNLILAGGRGLGNGSAPATQTLAGNITVAADTGIDPGNNAVFHISSTITGGAGALSLVNVGSTNPKGTLKLSGNNTGWTGKLAAENIDAVKIWVIDIADERNLGGNPAVFAADQLKLSGATLRPSATFTINDSNRGIQLGAFGGTFENGDGIRLTVDVPVSGAGNLTQSGNGTLVLTAANSFTGTALVQSGNLVLSGSGSLAASGNIIVASGAVLDVTTRTDGRLAIGSGQTLQGAGTVSGNLSLAAASNFSYNAVAGAGAESAILVQGDLTLDGSLRLTGLESLPNGSYTFPLIRYTGTLTNNTLDTSALPAAFTGAIVIDAVNKQVNLTGTMNGSVWALAATAKNSQATLAWTATAGATSYNVKRATSPAGPFTTVNNVAASPYTDSPLLNGTTYYYQVAAVAAGVETASTSVAPATPSITAGTPAMYFGDSVRLKRPFAKDPTVIRFQGRYLMYYSQKDAANKWSVAIAESTDLVNWTRVAEFLYGGTGPDKNGLAAPCARVIGGKVHMFYQSYTGAPSDRICHAVSDDGLVFTRDPANPIFGPSGSGVWNNGRAIDADYIEFNGKMFLSCATRDTTNTIQEVVVASAPTGTDYSAAVWSMVTPDGPTFAPQQATWEQKCIEGQTMCVRNNQLYMFYGGAYNNAPQQIGCAVSPDGTTWTRLPSLAGLPFFADGAAGTWNASESGHPGVFIDDDEQTYLFFQGNNDNGNTWYLSVLKLGWNANGPFIKPGVKAIPDAAVAIGTATASSVALMYPVPTADTLTLSANSTNSLLLPPGSLSISGTGCGRTLSTTPAAGTAGTAQITVTATDTNGQSDTATFTLTVGTPQEIWRQQWFGSPSNSGPFADDADPNGDGETNFFEFATGQNPNAATTRQGALVQNGSTLEFTFSRGKAAMGLGVTSTAEYSDTLAPGSWLPAPGGVAVLSDDGVVQTVKATVPANPGGKRFVRLRITQPPP